MNNFTVGDFCRLFCCPPRPSRVVAKFAFLPPAPSYNVVRHTNPRGSNTSPDLSNGSGDSYHYTNDDGIRVFPTSTDSANQKKSSSPPTRPSKPPTTSPTDASGTNNHNNRSSPRQKGGAEPKHEIWKLTFNQPNEYPLSNWARNRIEMFFTVTRARNRIACMFVPTDVTPPSPYVILFSHGNAVDLGQMSGFLTSLAQSFGIHVFCYDYSGYGLSTGHPLESNLYADAEAMLQAVMQRYGYPMNKIVLYGQSIGTAPTVELASRYKVAGVVLHSALMSGIRVVCPGTTRRYCFDPFTNIDKVERIQSPTLVIHGEADEIITVEHGYQLFERLRNPVEPIWIEDAGHNDIESFPEYAERLARFLRTDLPQFWKDEATITNSVGTRSAEAIAGPSSSATGGTASRPPRGGEKYAMDNVRHRNTNAASKEHKKPASPKETSSKKSVSGKERPVGSGSTTDISEAVGGTNGGGAGPASNSPSPSKTLVSTTSISNNNATTVAPSDVAAANAAASSTTSLPASSEEKAPLVASGSTSSVHSHTSSGKPRAASSTVVQPPPPLNSSFSRALNSIDSEI